MTKPLKHVYDHKRRVNTSAKVKPLSDAYLSPNEERILLMLEAVEGRLGKLEAALKKRK